MRGLVPPGQATGWLVPRRAHSGCERRDLRYTVGRGRLSVRANLQISGLDPPQIRELERPVPAPLVLLQSARKHWLLVALITVAVTVVASFVTLSQKRIYRAEATILFDPHPARPLGTQVEEVVQMSGPNGYFGNREYYTTQHWLIRSRRTAESVVKQLGLHCDGGFLRNLPPGQKAIAESSVADAANVLLSRVAVDPVKDSRLSTVSYHDADPVRAQRIVSVLVDTYVQSNLDDVLDTTNTASDWLHDQAATLKQELEQSEMALHDYKRDKSILSVSLDDQSNMLREEMEQLNGVLTGSRAKREQIAARRTELAQVAADNPSVLPARELLDSATLQRLREDYLRADQEVKGLMGAGKGEKHPLVEDAASRREAARASLLAEVRNIQGAVERELRSIDREVSGLQKLFDSARARAQELNLLEIEFNRLRRSKENNEKLFSLVVERSKESDLARMLRVNNVRVVERPAEPRSPVSPNIPGGVGAGVLAGLALGLMAAFGREKLDRSLRSPDEVERELGLAFLGFLPSLAAEGKRSRAAKASSSPDDRELIVHRRPTSGTAEAARSIRTNVLFMSPDRPYRTLLVTSPGPSEGKTTVACNIASAMAQAGRRVVLLDCDMRRPRLHRVFGKPMDRGITTALLEKGTLDSVIYSTEVPNLSVVTTGPLPPHPAELLHSESFAKLLGGLRDRFDLVVIDSPPVLPVTDAAVLSTAVDGTILVTRAFQTRRDMAKRAARALRDVGAHLVGVVLNGVDLEKEQYGYRYYYSREGYAAAPPIPPTPPSGSDRVA
jgi:succinoglycan biosynthesis transport protein ExoP